MKPIMFSGVTAILRKPDSMTDEDCAPLPIMNDGRESVSCWRLTFPERIKVFLLGRVWLGVLAGKTQPPVRLAANKLEPFNPSDTPAQEDKK